jgi:TRAP-type C4-dicarboxylate transport system substrate-binding protein
MRVGTAAPDGTGWAREFRAFGRYVEAEAKGALRIKLYMNSVAGDELEMGERVRKGQLDGVASGHFLCEALAPSMRVFRMPGVFQSRDEAHDVVTRMQSTITDEAAKNGFVVLGAAGLGPDVFFTRAPVRSLEDARRLKLWRWDIDEVGIAASRDMGLTIVPTRVGEARHAYDDGKVDGFLAAPSAALAFQWSAQAGYVTDLLSGYLYGCLVFGEPQFQKLPLELQSALRAGAARMLVGIEELGRRQDELLLGGLFAKQGLKAVPVSPSFRAEYFAAAKATRDRLPERLMPRALLERVLRMLADYRIEHPQQR